MTNKTDTYTGTLNTSDIPLDEIGLYRPRDRNGKYIEPAIRPWAASEIWEKYISNHPEWRSFSVGSYIDDGAFGSVYQIHNDTNSRAFCIKIIRVSASSRNANNSEKDACDLLRTETLPNTIKYVAEPHDISINLNYRIVNNDGCHIELLRSNSQANCKNSYGVFPFTVYIMSLYNESLNALVDRNDKPDLDRIIQIGIDISKSLSVLHSKLGRIHTDVKPGNILVKYQSERGQAHPKYFLADFNSTADLRPEGEDTYTSEFSLPITKRFADPMLSKTIRRPEYDIYCLAATMYWCCNDYYIERLVDPRDVRDGRCIVHPYSTKLPKIEKNRERPKNISDGLWEILSKAMDKNLNNRYKSADEFREALEELRNKESTARQKRRNRTNRGRVQLSSEVESGKSSSAKLGDKIFYSVCFAMILIGLLARLSFAGKLLPGTAHNIAGYVYSEGIFLEQNAVHAARLYSEGANMDNARCAYNLGKMYYHGKGVEESHTDAAFWYLKSANLGFAPAQFEMGRAFEYGDGVEQDTEQAIRFYSLAVDQGHKEAKENLNKLQEKIVNSTAVRPAAEDRETTQATSFVAPNGGSTTYIQVLEPSPQDFICQIYECTETDIFTSWNSLGYSFNAVSKELTLHLNYRDNRKIYNTMTATFSSSPFTDAAIKEAVSLYPDLWAADSPSNSQLLKEFSLGIPLENWTSETAYILLLNMGKDYEVLSYTIIKVSNIPINGMPISDWVEIQGSMHYMHNIGLDVNYSLGTADSADIVASYSDNDGETWTMLDEVTVSVDEQSTGKTWLWVDLDKLTNNILDAPDYQYKVYMHPKERDDSWTPLASSQPVDSHL